MSKTQKALRLALEALEESLGYVEEEAENAQRLYGQYPTRQARIQGLKDDARKHMDAITAIREALAEQPAQQGIEHCLWARNGHTPCPHVQPAQHQDSETIVQTFTGLPKRKLRDLLAAGWQINGVCFQRTEENGTVRRGAATTGGTVLWWNQPAQQEQEPVAYDKTEINCFAQDLYDQKMREGKRGHYESMFHVIHQCIKKVSPPASKPLTDEQQIAEALRRHGLTLVKTAKGYEVMNLGQITAHGIKGDA